MDRLSLPKSLRAVLQARLDRVPAEQRAMLETGSVEGVQFHLEAVAELADRPTDVVRSNLGRLVKSGLLDVATPELPASAAFAFITSYCAKLPTRASRRQGEWICIRFASGAAGRERRVREYDPLPPRTSSWRGSRSPPWGSMEPDGRRSGAGPGMGCRLPARASRWERRSRRVIPGAGRGGGRRTGGRQADRWRR